MKKTLFALATMALLGISYFSETTVFAQTQTIEKTNSTLTQLQEKERAFAEEVKIATISPVQASDEKVEMVVSAGNKYIGHSVYVFGGGRSQSDIERGHFDCSGFVSWAFKQAGLSLPASTSQLVNEGTKVSSSEMKPGDIVFFDTSKKNGHVGIYVGNGKFIGSQSSTGVAIADMTQGYWKKKFSGRVNRVL